MENFPLFEFKINPDDVLSGVKTVSIVTDPAFGSGAVFFSDTIKPKFIAMGDVKKQIVAGLSLIPNLRVYRFDEEIGGYYGYFSAETIAMIVEKYHQEMLSNKVNLEHNENAFIDAFLIEDFIVDSEARVQDLASKGISHPNIIGAWYTAFKVKDPQVFQTIINSGDATGFSVECFLDKVLIDFGKEVKNKIIDNKVNIKMKKNNKTLLDKIVALFTVESFTRALVPELAFEIEWGNVGEPVNKVIVDPDGIETLQLIGQGEFITEEGIIVVDEASNLVEIRELPINPAEIEQPEAEIEVPISGDTIMAVSGDTSIVGYPEVSGTTSGETSMTMPVIKTGIEKSILEIVGTNDGEYTILVRVEGGVVISAEALTMTNLMLSRDTEILNLKAKVQVLEDQMKEPIADPVIIVPATDVDYNKLSQYEKLMYKKGLQPFNMEKNK